MAEYGVIQVPDSEPTGLGGQMIINNDKALNDARGVRKVETTITVNNGYSDYGSDGYGSGSEATTPGVPALISEVALAKLETFGYLTHTAGSGAVNLQPELYEIGSGVSSSDGFYSTVSGGRGNRAGGSYSTVVGGESNIASGEDSIAGGVSATAGGSQSVALGCQAFAYGSYSAVVGGYYNHQNGGYGAIVGGSSNSVNNYCSGIVGGNNNTVNGDYSVILGSNNSQCNTNYTAVLAGENLIMDYYEPYSVAFGQGGSGASKGRSVLRGLVEKVGMGGDPTATLEMAVASLGSTSVALVEVDVIHANSSTSTFTFSQYLVKVIGTTPTVVDTKGDSSQGTFTMSNGKLIYTSANALTAMRATVRITAMADGSSSNYYYYNY